MEKLVSTLVLSPRIKKQYDQKYIQISIHLTSYHHITTGSRKNSAKLDSFLLKSCKLVLHLILKCA